MKQTADGFDTELILDETNNVLIGSMLVPTEQRETKAWELEVLQKFSKSVSFVPTILDYQIKNGAVEYAMSNLGTMYPLEYYVLDLVINPTLENIKKFIIIKSHILNNWRHQINLFCLQHNVIIELGKFMDGCVITNNDKIYFLNLINAKVKPGNEEEYLNYLRHKSPSASDKNILEARFLELYVNFRKYIGIEELEKTHKRNFEMLKLREEKILKTKNKKLENSISKDIIKAQLGLEQYKFYFGDSDG